MERSTVIALLEKYWQAETTIAEEQDLAAYFQGTEVDAGLLPYRDLFAYFQEEAQISAGPDFGDRILQRLGLPLDGARPANADAARIPHTHAGEGPDEARVIPLAGKPFRLGVIAAAAAIAAIVASLFLITPAGRPVKLAAVHTATGMVPTQMKDTYEDPEQALAAVRHALLIASHQLNQGRRQLAGARK
jgi:hypothetical protein